MPGGKRVVPGPGGQVNLMEVPGMGVRATADGGLETIPRDVVERVEADKGSTYMRLVQTLDDGVVQFRVDTRAHGNVMERYAADPDSEGGSEIR